MKLSYMTFCLIIPIFSNSKIWSRIIVLKPRVTFWGQWNPYHNHFQTSHEELNKYLRNFHDLFDKLGDLLGFMLAPENNPPSTNKSVAATFTPISWSWTECKQPPGNAIFPLSCTLQVNGAISVLTGDTLHSHKNTR